MGGGDEAEISSTLKSLDLAPNDRPYGPGEHGGFIDLEYFGSSHIGEKSRRSIKILTRGSTISSSALEMVTTPGDRVTFFDNRLRIFANHSPNFRQPCFMNFF